MSIVRKSRWRSHNLKRHWQKRANQRAAKDRKRMIRALRDEPMPDTSRVVAPKARHSGFVVSIRCLDDGKRVRFTAYRTLWGLSVSPTLAGRKVAAFLAKHQPAQPKGVEVVVD